MNMKTVSLDVWVQLLGMLSVLAGLLFVGLEMRQSQQIALAAQQQARMEVFVDAVGIMSDGGVSYQNFLANGITDDNETHVENFLHQLWWIFENDFLQYNLGLMDESVWEAKLRAIIQTHNGGNNLSCSRARLIWNNRRDVIDPELVSLVESFSVECAD
jgi:hypothetical protein